MWRAINTELYIENDIKLIYKKHVAFRKIQTYNVFIVVEGRMGLLFASNIIYA